MRLGGTGSWEGTQQRQPTPSGQRDIPPWMVSCSVYKLGAKLVGGCSSGTGWALVRWWWAIALCLTCFLYSFIIVIVFALLNSLNLWILLSPPHSLPRSTGGRGGTSKWVKPHSLSCSFLDLQCVQILSLEREKRSQHTPEARDAQEQLQCTWYWLDYL